GILFVLAMASLGVYGVVLGGWASNNRWSLLGGIRGSAQMISYEIAMGLALIGVVLTFNTLDLQEMVRQQGRLLWGWLPAWGALPGTRRLSSPWRGDARRRVVGGRDPPGHQLRREGHPLHLAADRHPLDPPTLPLRSAHAARLAGSAADRARERPGHGPGGGPGGERMNPLFFLLLAVLTVAAAISVIATANPVHSALGLVVTLFLLSVFFVALDAQLVA